ncbi:MAG: acyl-CoA thioesterase [Brevibacterium sp.]|uniref:acyl-CoA thioesterase n=1 Tax=Brevibacterium sandarakinum TaxID=629680 RepID=UPI00264DFA66|nr:thioesterase family protein [Brevibacterium sandarakinum]MDN5588140.1 acyl-CoA thioesterase [Brevibacterium sp.]MDN5634851.1 acyl-CoA thioesterase [Brevibacterium sp.]MDN5658494.1 acyl-CoA thioesterase [Brevibacterium sandarakinum]
MKTFEYSPEVRWSDQDMLGHVNNARMITLVEECRIKWLHEEKAARITGGGMLVVHQSIDYILPVMYGPELRMTVTVSKIGNTSFTVNTRGEQEGNQVFNSDVVLVHLDRDTGRPAPIAEDIRALLESYLA